jgi:NADH-ubiquinone oxidoreductase chain 4
LTGALAGCSILLEIDIASLRMGWLTFVGILMAIIASEFNKILNCLWLLITTALLIRFFSKNLFFFYILFEFSIVPILLIVVFFGAQPERLSARFYLLIYTRLFSLPLLVLVIIVNSIFIEPKQRYFSIIIIIIIYCPFLVKIPVMGLHYWLPKAHVEARTRGSIILAGLLLKLGSYGVFRLSLLFYRIPKNTTILWLWLVLLSSFITIIQSDIKKLIAYRSVVHITLIIITIFTDLYKVRIILLISLAHGGASIMLFLIKGAIRRMRGSRLITLLVQEESFSWTVYLGGAALLINSSMPPATSFFPELLLIFCTIKENPINFLIFVVISLVVCYYNILILKRFLQTKTLGRGQALALFRYSVLLAYGALISFTFIFWIAFFFKRIN